MPTGGINAGNLTSYLDFKKIIACGGSWMVKGDLIKAGEFDKIRDLTKEAVETMLGFDLAHVGINGGSAEAAEEIAKAFQIFGFPTKVGNSSVFAGTVVEVMKSPSARGTNGHLGIRTNYMDRAIYYLESKGYKFIPETAKYAADGTSIKAIYMEGEIGGFAIHLMQK